MISLVANKGLGDALYQRAITWHLLEQGTVPIRVFAWWPDAFLDFPNDVEVMRMELLDKYKVNLRHVAYRLNSPKTTTNQFATACQSVGLNGHVDLKLNWKVRNYRLFETVKRRSVGRPILLYQPLKRPRSIEQHRIRPHDAAFERYLKAHVQSHFCIRIGHRAYLSEPWSGGEACHMDLVGKTSIPDLFDLALASDQMFCEPCFIVVLAEAANKPFTCMFAARAKQFDITSVSRNVTPERIFYKPHLATVLYDE